MTEVLGGEAECQSFFEALDRLASHPQKALRVHPDRPGFSAFLEREFPTLKAVPWCSNGFFLSEEEMKKIQSNPWAGTGAFYIQEPGAMEAVEMLAPRPGEQCLDLCAAPGSKATQILERLRGQGRCVVNEVVRARAAKLDLLVARHGYTNVDVLSLDPSEIARLYAGCFTTVLVDAPCSGESLFAKRQEHRSDISDNEIQGCARRQKAILRDALRLLAPGGRCVYSTCAYSREENEDVVQSVLADFPDVHLKEESRRWPHTDGVPGGYAALLVHSGESRPAVPFSSDPHGLIRSGIKNWDGSIHVYAQAMAIESSEDLMPVEVSEADARKFLRGESLARPAHIPAGMMVSVQWQGCPLGSGKAVEDRINNSLPKILRA